jgi:hypothetical protein
VFCEAGHEHSYTIHITSIPCLSMCEIVFDSGRINVGFVVHVVALGQVILPVLQASPATANPSIFHTHAFYFYQKGKREKSGDHKNYSCLFGHRRA